MAPESGQRGSTIIDASAPGVWGRLRNIRRYCLVRVEDASVALVRSTTGSGERVPLIATDAVGWRRGRLGGRLWLQTSGGRTLEIGGLPPDRTASVVAIIEQRVEALARGLEDRGRTVTTRLDEWFCGADYLRASQSRTIRDQLDHLANESPLPTGELTLRRLSRESRQALIQIR